jgi:hypothetical protein
MKYFGVILALSLVLVMVNAYGAYDFYRPTAKPNIVFEKPVKIPLIYEEHSSRPRCGYNKHWNGIRCVYNRAVPY